MLRAILIPLFLLAFTPRPVPLPGESIQPSPVDKVEISSPQIVPGSSDNLLADITIKYALQSPSTVFVKVIQNQELISTIVDGSIQEPGDYAYVWDGKNNSGAYVEEGLYELVIDINGTKVKSLPIEANSFIAKIDVPGENDLVRAHVPIFGTACGRNFDKYVIEYRKENSVNSWTTIEESTVPKVNKIHLGNLIIGDETLYGNLTTWDTGLSNYYYYDTDIDLLGTYVIRLTVFGKKGDKTTDEVKVDVGRVVSFVYGGIVVSEDKQVWLSFPEHAIKKPFILFNISRQEGNYLDTKKNRDGYKLVSEVYEIAPEGTSFARPVLLSMHYEVSKVENDKNLGLYIYDPAQERWAYLEVKRSTDENVNNGIVSTEIYSLPGHYAYVALFERLKGISSPVIYNLPKKTRLNAIDVYGETEPGQKVMIYVNGKSVGKVNSDNKTGVFKFGKAALDEGINKITCRAIDEFGNFSQPSNKITITYLRNGVRNIVRDATDLYSRVSQESNLLSDATNLYHNTFESNFGEWANLDLEEGASLSLNTDVEPNNGSCLKLTNQKKGGSFGAIVTATPYNVVDYPMTSFDYKLPPGVKINFLAKVGTRWYDIRFTDNDKVYKRINMIKIGEIENVLCDNKWHHAEFNLYEMLKKHTKGNRVKKIIMADYDVTGYMKLGYGHNPKGAVFYIDNFIIKKGEDISSENTPYSEISMPQWEIGQDDDSSYEFLYEKDVDDDYYAGEPMEEFERAITETDPKTNIKFYLSREDVEKQYSFFIKAENWDLEQADHVDFDILLNGEKIKSISCPYEAGTIFDTLIKSGLVIGWNILSLEWTGGGRWISWDYMKFRPVDEYKPYAIWQIGYDNGSFNEFSHEIDVDDDYFIGQDFKNFERAISIQDPVTNIKFYLEKNMLNADYELSIKPFDMQPIDTQPKSSGVFFEIAVNNNKHTYNITSEKKILRIPLSKNILNTGENTITLRWLAGCDWIAWDYISFRQVTE